MKGLFALDGGKCYDIEISRIYYKHLHVIQLMIQLGTHTDGIIIILVRY